jgi:hypothetical protein
LIGIPRTVTGKETPAFDQLNRFMERDTSSFKITKWMEDGALEQDEVEQNVTLRSRKAASTRPLVTIFLHIPYIHPLPTALNPPVAQSGDE